jgi:myo-inositol 2-dehydrogenase / D-chiro-inositol 1-dehydrogenase
MDNSSLKSPVRIGLVGCGRLAEFGYLPAFRRASGVTLAGVADVNLHRCEQVVPEIPAYQTIHELLQADGMDAVIISTPTRYHLADTMAACRAKLPILLEKPPGIDLSEAEALHGLVPRPWIGFNRRFDPDLARLRSNVPRDEMLDVRLELHYRRNAWNPFDMRDDALLDLGPHLIDLARWLTVSEVISVRAHTVTQVHAEFELELGRGQARVICSCNSPYRESVQVRTSDGRRVGIFRRGGIVAGIIGKLSPWRENPLVTSLVGQLEAFAQAVRSGSSRSLASVVDGLAVMSTISAVRQSAMKGGSSCPVG